MVIAERFLSPKKAFFLVWGNVVPVEEAQSRVCCPWNHFCICGLSIVKASGCVVYSGGTACEFLTRCICCNDGKWNVLFSCGLLIVLASQDWYWGCWFPASQTNAAPNSRIFGDVFSGQVLSISLVLPEGEISQNCGFCLFCHKVLVLLQKKPSKQFKGYDAFLGDFAKESRVACWKRIT